MILKRRDRGRRPRPPIPRFRNKYRRTPEEESMTRNRWTPTGTFWMAMVLMAAFSGCGKKPEPPVPGPQAGNPPSVPAPPPQAPLVPKVQIADWCKEHGVPESVCTRCHENLVAEFKKKGDWCGGHNLPESQCIACHPELEAKFKAMAPKGGNP